MSLFGILNLWFFPHPYLSLHINITIGYGAFALNETLLKIMDERSLNY